MRPIIFTSDFHLGKGDQADDFSGKAEKTYRAMRHKRSDARHVHLGDLLDTEDDLAAIMRAHLPLLCSMDLCPTVIIPGNHDGDIKWLRAFGFRVLPLEKIILINGQRTLLTHGHQFDPYNKPGTSTGKLVTRLVSFLENNVHKDIDAPLVRMKNLLSNSIREYEEAIAARAKELGCTQAIYGHTHYPCLRIVDGILIANCGTWTHDFGGKGYPVIMSDNLGLSLRYIQTDGVYHE